MASNPKYHDPDNWSLVSETSPNFVCEWDGCQGERSNTLLYMYEHFKDIYNSQRGRRRKHQPVFLCIRHLKKWCPILKQPKKPVYAELEAMRELLQELKRG